MNMQTIGKKIINALDKRGYDLWTKCLFNSYFGGKCAITLVLKNPDDSIRVPIEVDGENWELKIQIKDNFTFDDEIIEYIKEIILEQLPKKLK